MRLQVLKFPFHSVWDLFADCGGLDMEEHLGNNRQEVKPRIGKPGWYYDRDTKSCWYEFPDGTAWEADVERFRYEIDCLNAQERPLTEQERKAIQTLSVYRNTGNLAELLNRKYRDDYRLQLKGTLKSISLACLADRKSATGI